MPRNQQIVLDNRPQGKAVASNFKLVATDTPAAAATSLIRTVMLKSFPLKSSSYPMTASSPTPRSPRENPVNTGIDVTLCGIAH